MISAQEYYEMVKSRRKLIFCLQMQHCEFAIYTALECFDSEIETGHFEVELETHPVPELISELSRLGYTNIHFSTEKVHSYGMIGILSFEVPQLANNQAHSFNKNTL